MQADVQVRVVTHAWMDPDFWERTDRLASRGPADPHPFVTPDLFRAWVAELKTTAAQRLEAAKAADSRPPGR